MNKQADGKNTLSQHLVTIEDIPASGACDSLSLWVDPQHVGIAVSGGPHHIAGDRAYKDGAGVEFDGETVTRRYIQTLSIWKDKQQTLL